MTMLSCFALLVAATSLPPLLVTRASLRIRVARIDVSLSALALALWLLLPRLSIELSPGVAIAAFVTAKLAVFSLLLAWHRDSEEVDWAPWRGAVLAGAVYLALVPFVLALAPVDGDEPFYLLVTESVVHDGDFDLANQYSSLERSVTRRTDLRPQLGDPVGSAGERYSRHEPFLSLILIPGYLVAGLHGAVATIAILAALGVFSILLLLEEEGFSRRTILVVFPLLAFGPPLIAYATRIWPEAPAALLFSEALRAARRGKRTRSGIAVVLLGLLKIRFAVISAALVAGWILVNRGNRKKALVALALLAIPAVAIVLFYPRIVTVRMFDPEDVFTVRNYVRGFAGLLVDGQAGLLFQAPFWLLGLLAAFRWRELGLGAKLGILAALPYLLLLFPRSEWHGGWSPPLRYLVVFLPLFALLAASAVERLRSAGVIAAAVAWSAGLTFYGLAWPTGLFQIASGESVWGRWLGAAWEVDVSRLIPSAVRPNVAAAVALVLVTLAAALALVRRDKSPVARSGSATVAAVLTIALVAGCYVARTPRSVVELEDAHVRHDGGAAHPDPWAPARFRFRGGWHFRPGATASFLYTGGGTKIWYRASVPSAIEIGGRRVALAPTGDAFAVASVGLPELPGRYTLRCVEGDPVVDRIVTE